MRLIGYDTIPEDLHAAEMDAYVARKGWASDIPQPPSQVKAVYADDEGNWFFRQPGADGIEDVPYRPPSPKQDTVDSKDRLIGRPSPEHDASMFPSPTGNGPVRRQPTNGGKKLKPNKEMLPLGELSNLPGALKGGAPKDDPDLLERAREMAESEAKKLGKEWAKDAALNLLLGAAPEGDLSKALAALGIDNPVALGDLNAALGSLGHPDGLMGRLGLDDTLDTVKDWLGIVKPSAASLTAPLPKSGDSDGLFSSSNMAGAADYAADKLLGLWKPDDESSAAEHIGKNMADRIKKSLLTKENIKDALGDLSSVGAKVSKFIDGYPAIPGFQAVRITDADNSADFSIIGVANILFEGLPVSREGDMVVGPLAPPPGEEIAKGEPSVLSANEPTAHVGSPTKVGTLMVKGAATITVGGAVAAAKAAAAAEAKSKANKGPKAPDAPDKGGSGSAGKGSEGEGNPQEASTSDTTAADSSASDSAEDASQDTSDSTANTSDSTADTSADGSETAAENPSADGLSADNPSSGDSSSGDTSNDESSSNNESSSGSSNSESTGPENSSGANQASSAGKGSGESSESGSNSTGESNANPTETGPTTPDDRTLCVNSNEAEGKGDPGFTDGHANLSVHHPDGTNESYGLWPDSGSKGGKPNRAIAGAGLDNGNGSDIRKNFPNDNPDRYDYSYCEEISDKQYQEFQKEINKGQQWTPTNTCASFASETFEKVTGTDVDADDIFGFETPREVGQHIVELNGGKNSNRNNPKKKGGGNESGSSSSSV